MIPHIQPLIPILFPLTEWMNWPINKFHVRNQNWRQILPCYNIHVYSKFICKMTEHQNWFLNFKNCLRKITKMPIKCTVSKVNVEQVYNFWQWSFVYHKDINFVFLRILDDFVSYRVGVDIWLFITLVPRDKKPYYLI